MDIRAVLDDCHGAVKAHFGSMEQCPQLEQIQRLAEQVKTAKKDLKQLKKDKQAVACQFKDAKGDGERLATLKAEMQAVSARVNEVEEQRKADEQQLRDLFTAAKPSIPDLPERYRHVLPEGELTAGIKVRPATAADAGAWNAYCEQHPAASAYHHFGWKAVIETVFGHGCEMWLAIEGQTIVGLLPLCHMHSRLFGDLAVSVPYVNYGGPLADNRAIARKLVERAWQHATEDGCKSLELRTCHAGWHWPASSKKVSMLLRLPDSPAELDSNLGAKVRAQYKQTEQYGPEVRVGGEELLDDYYFVFSRNMRDLGTPVYTRNLFRAILQQFPTQAHLVVVYIAEKPAGCAFLFGYKDVMEIPWASTLKRYNAMNVNMWMYRQILDFTQQQGYRYFDFGRSTVDAGTYKFKKQWGAKPVQHYWYYLLPEGESLPEINPDNPKYKLVINTWKRMPVWLTNMLGPHIVKDIP